MARGLEVAYEPPEGDMAAGEDAILNGGAPGGEASKENAVKAAVADLVPMTMAVKMQLRHPKNGMVAVEFDSTVPGRDERAAMMRMEAFQRGSFPATAYTEGQNMLFRAWARIRVQLRVPESAAWAWDVMACDEDLVMRLGGRLAEHEHLYFRGHLEALAGAEGQQRVMVPALDRILAAAGADPGAGAAAAS